MKGENYSSFLMAKVFLILMFALYYSMNICLSLKKWTLLISYTPFIIYLQKKIVSYFWRTKTFYSKNGKTLFFLRIYPLFIFLYFFMSNVLSIDLWIPNFFGPWKKDFTILFAE